MAILPPGNSTATEATKRSLATPALAGIASAGAVLLIIAACCLYIYVIKLRKKKRTAAMPSITRQDSVIIKSELDGTTAQQMDIKQEICEAEGRKAATAVEIGEPEVQPVYELPAREEVAAEMTAVPDSGQRGRHMGILGRKKRYFETEGTLESEKTFESPILGTRTDPGNRI